jgi:hypothetical protein
MLTATGLRSGILIAADRVLVYFPLLPGVFQPTKWNMPD